MPTRDSRTCVEGWSGFATSVGVLFGAFGLTAIVGSRLLAPPAGSRPWAVKARAIGLLFAATALLLRLCRAGNRGPQTTRLQGEEDAAGRWLQTVMDQMPEGVIVLDASGKVALMNRAARALSHPVPFGFDPLENPYVFDVRWPSGAPVPWEELPLARAIVRGESVKGIELLVRKPDETVLPVIASASPVRDDQGRAAGAIVVFQDVSLLKELERLREEWATLVAHDLKQPINVIAMAAAQFSVGPMTESQGQAVERIRKATGALVRMISDLSDVSSLESRRLPLHRTRLPLSEWVPEFVDRIGPSFEGHRVLLQTARELPDVFADPMRIEQILTNLLTNAAKYGEKGGDIQVSAEQRDAEVVMAVTNRGPTLAQTEIERLFTRFYRTETARSRGDGLGLGLYITKGLVEAHGGKIEAQSVSGKTTFRFTLPVWRDVHRSAGEPSAPAPEKGVRANRRP
jgi:signal transduction histidine kinase